MKTAATRVAWVLSCEHASASLPREYHGLGVSRHERYDHIGWDIGARGVQREIAKRLGAPAVASRWSRLLIDCNRDLHDDTLIVHTSDGVRIPGNVRVSRAERARRIALAHTPYHTAMDRMVARAKRAHPDAAVQLLALHSFTPVMNGEDRPWQVGILWRGDQRLSAPVLAALRARGDLVVGDNQPYSGIRDFGFTVQFHAQRPRLPHVMIEVRQNEIDTPEGAQRYAAILHAALAPTLAEPALYRLHEGDNLDRAGGLISLRHATQDSPLA